MSFFDSQKSKLFVHKYDLTAFTTDFEAGGSAGLRPVTTFADASEALIVGIQEGIKAQWQGLFDDGTAGSDVILDDIRGQVGERPITYWPGGIAAVGDVGYGGGVRYMESKIKSSVGDAVRTTAEFDLDQFDHVVALGATQAYTSTTNEASIDGGASSTAGFTFSVHVPAADGTYDILFQDSADDVAFATVITFSAGAAASTRSVQTGTLRRFVRLRVVLNAATSVTVAAGFTRR